MLPPCKFVHINIFLNACEKITHISNAEKDVHSAIKLARNIKISHFGWWQEKENPAGF